MFAVLTNGVRPVQACVFVDHCTGADCSGVDLRDGERPRGTVRHAVGDPEAVAAEVHGVEVPAGVFRVPLGFSGKTLLSSQGELGLDESGAYGVPSAAFLLGRSVPGAQTMLVIVTVFPKQVFGSVCAQGQEGSS